MTYKSPFIPADILLPAKSDMTRWSVVACDQYSSEPEYWARVDAYVGGVPSTLRMVIPEAYLSKVTEEEETGRIAGNMEGYLRSGLLNEYGNSFIYVSRKISTGRLRRGIVGKLDLEKYDHTPGTQAEVRASEGTVLSRLPARIRLREKATLELPHVLVLIDDPGDGVITAAGAAAERTLYDYELMENGGHITGKLVADPYPVLREIDALMERAKEDAVFIVGDGNHSLAAAKAYWDALAPTLTEQSRAAHPARYALVEVVNVHDDSLVIEPIHRAVFGVDPKALAAELKGRFNSEAGVPVSLISQEGELGLKIPGSLAEAIGALQELLEAYTAKHGGDIDYIHGDETLLSLVKERGAAGLLFPALDRGALFGSVNEGRVFPKKSFSMGIARDKRYYLECRKIK